ncbi:hypothetical protein [Paenibacillus mucilaginosus]
MEKQLRRPAGRCVSAANGRTAKMRRLDALTGSRSGEETAE